MTAATSEPVKLEMNAMPHLPGMPRSGRSRGRNRTSDALNAPSCSNTPSRPQKNMTAGIRLKPAMKPSFAPVPPLPMRFAPVSPICPNEPARLVKSRTLIGPSAVRNAPDSTRMSTISASHAPIPIFSLFSACFSLFAMSFDLLIPFMPPLIRQPLQNRRSAYTLRMPQARCAGTAILLPHIRPGCDCPRRARPCRTLSARRTLP